MAKKAAQVIQEEPVIKPLVKVSGEKHILETMFEGDTDNMPILKSVGFAKASQSSTSWVSYVIKTQGARVLEIEVSEPDQKAIASDNAKTDFVRILVDEE